MHVWNARVVGPDGAKSRGSAFRSATKRRDCGGSALWTHKTGGARESGRSFAVASVSSSSRLGGSEARLTMSPIAWATRTVAVLPERYRQSAQSAECGGWQYRDECSSTCAWAVARSDVDMASANAVAGPTASCSSAQLPIRRRAHFGRTDMEWTIAGLLCTDNLRQSSSGCPEPSSGQGCLTNGVDRRDAATGVEVLDCAKGRRILGCAHARATTTFTAATGFIVSNFLGGR
jgi:hypothetical protein